METIALLCTGIVSLAIFIGSVAYWQYAVEFLMSLGLSQAAAVVGPIPTVMLIGFAIDWYRNSRNSPEEPHDCHR